MEKINWGIIGCGDVTEVKSGPAFNKVPNSSLVAVMRRDAAKAEDYARRHHVPKWYSNANELINDPAINAIYIATPPSTHHQYCLQAIQAGKPVYVEKPVAMNYAEAIEMSTAAAGRNIKMVVAHYRREQPFFKKIKQLLDDGAIGKVRLARLEFYKPLLTAAELAVEKTAWRVDPAVAGGGLFHDLAPHQVDLMYHFFGAVEKINGIATNQAGAYAADDLVAGNILFKNGVAFTGSWCFSAGIASDRCEIIGSEGTISFAVFNNNQIELVTKEKTMVLDFENLEHVQQPMIKQTVAYFLGQAPNPGPAEEAAEVMRIMEVFVQR